MHFEIFNGRSSFYQWDLNQKIIIEGLGQNKQVHFKSEGERNALVLEAYTENGKTVVNVPNKLLQKAGKIVVWVYVYESERYTEEQAVFAVKPRQKPSNYLYTETEVLDYQNHNERLEALEDSVSGWVTPEQFGAVGDGVTDDTNAVQAAVDSGKKVLMTQKYLVTKPIRIKRDHVVIDGLDCELWVKNNFAIKAEARHFDISIGKCQSVYGSGTVETTPVFPAGSGFFLFDANFDVVRSDLYWYSYGYGNVFIGEAKFMEYGIRLCPEIGETSCGIEYTVFSGNDLWCEKCIDLTPQSNNRDFEAWANQNTFIGFRLRGKFGVFIDSNRRWTVNGNTFYRCGLEGFLANGAGIYCNGISNSFKDLRNAEVESLGENAVWVSLGANAEFNKFEFYSLNTDLCYIAESAYQNDFDAILHDDADIYYQGRTNHNYTFNGCFIAPDCKMRWIKATGGAVGLSDYVATPVTICSVPESENVVVWLSGGYGHMGIDELTMIINHGSEFSTVVMGTNDNVIHTFEAAGTYHMKYNPYTGGWDVSKVLTDLFADIVNNVPYVADNLYSGTRDFSGERWVNRGYWYDYDTEPYNGFKVLYNPAQWTGLYQRVWVKAGTKVTFSAYAKCTDGATIKLYTTTGAADDANVDGEAQNVIIQGINSEWARYSKTFTVWSDGYISPRLENETEGATLYVCGIKLEEGEKMTPWNTAVEDRAMLEGLPVVTTEDNGKILTVVDGKWTAVSNAN